MLVGNPTVIAASPELRIPRGTQTSSIPFLAAFVSGIPQPSNLNITWYFNDQSLPEGLTETGRDVLFPRNVQPRFAGMYMCQVTTSSGTASDNFVVIVTGEPLITLVPTSLEALLFQGETQSQRCS